MKRLLALVVAVGLVVGAWFVRDARQSDDGAAPPPADAPTLICSTEVRNACQQLTGVRITTYENPGATLDRLAAGGKLGADGWLVSQPWPGMVAVSNEPALADVSPVLARTPLELVTTQDRPDGLQCAPVTWTCVAEFAGSSAGFAHAGTDTTSGLLSVHGLATGLLGTTDYASNDFEDDDTFQPAFAAIEGAVADNPRGSSGDLADAIQTIRGAYSAVTALGTTAEIARKAFEAMTPSPQITADVVLAGHPDRFDLDEISDALLATNWLRSGDKSLRGANGLPKPGVMVALRELSR